MTLRQWAGTAFLVAAGLMMAAPAAAQSLGIGVRMAWVRSDVDADVDVDEDSVRFTGGQIRLALSPRFGVEVSYDRHSESFELLNEKVIQTPIQTSLLLRLSSGALSPYLLGGPGWYKRKVELIDGPDDVSVSSTEFGWHAGGGLEVFLGKHASIHGDYRYTFLDFNSDDDDVIGGGIGGGLIGGLLPGYKGSMWTLGASVYF